MDDGETYSVPAEIAETRSGLCGMAPSTTESRRASMAYAWILLAWMCKSLPLGDSNTRPETGACHAARRIFGVNNIAGGYDNGITECKL